MILPESIQGDDVTGSSDERFLYAEPVTGLARHKFNSWEDAVISTLLEDTQSEVIFRNPPLGLKSLSIPYEMDGRWRAFHPDFITVKLIEGERYIAISEPHRSDLRDFLPKAIGLANYLERSDVQDVIIEAVLLTEYNGRMRSLLLHDPLVRVAVRETSRFEELESIMLTL